MPPERRTIALSDGAASILHWAAKGPPAATIHFAHANGFNAQTYAGLLEPLAGRFDIYASDFRGHGLTQALAEPKRLKSWKTYAHDLERVLDQLPGAPFILAGHSMGATTSALVAAKRPDLVRGLVLAEPVILPPGFRIMSRAMKALGLYDRVMPMAVQAERRRKHWPDRSAAFESYRGRGAFKSWPERTLRDYLDGGLAQDPGGEGLVLACDPSWEAANYRAGPPSLWGLLTDIRTPVHLLTGLKGSTCSPAIAALLQQRLKRLTWKHFPDCSHFLPMERPETVADSLQAIAE
jgi:pimeloyl-ACP methyl ester carboxylesterase